MPDHNGKPKFEVRKTDIFERLPQLRKMMETSRNQVFAYCKKRYPNPEQSIELMSLNEFGERFLNSLAEQSNIGFSVRITSVKFEHMIPSKTIEDPKVVCAFKFSFATQGNPNVSGTMTARLSLIEIKRGKDVEHLVPTFVPEWYFVSERSQKRMLWDSK